MRPTIRALLLVLQAAGCLAPAALAQNVPTGFSVQLAVGEPFAALPVGFAFLPDGRILVIEKNTGNVRITPVGSTASIVIGTVTGLTAQGERGLLGVAVDPDWPARPYLYFHSTHTDSTIHLTMYTATGDLEDPNSTAVTLGSPYILLKDLDQYEHHNGGSVRFGPDGYLYASLGDDGRTCTAQDVDFLNGKILRLDVSHMPGVGPGPPPKADVTPLGNPFTGSDNARLVFARGLRNPFRFTIDPATNDVFIGDVGDLGWEEMDEITYATYAGANYGWPEYEGFAPETCCPQCTSRPPYTDPIYVYPNPPDPVSAAVVGGPVYRRVLGSPFSFGNEYDGSLFVADWGGWWIRRLVRSGGSWTLAAPVPGQPNAQDWATSLGGFVDLQEGPDGALYLIPWPGAALTRGVWRIVRTGAVDVANGAATPAGAHCFPDPARAALGIAILWPAAGNAAFDARIFTASGRLVRVLEGGDAVLRWNGRDAAGRNVGPGRYFYRLRGPAGLEAHGRFTLVR